MSEQEEVQQLRLMWDRLKHEWDNSGNIDWQPPAALMDASAGVLHMMLKRSGRDISDIGDSAFEFFTMFGQMMFTFGQFSYKNGLYRENLTPFTAVDDAELDKLLGNS